jgi:hypothetical protein
MSLRRLSLIGAALSGVAACGDPPPGDTYFDHTIQPQLENSCNNVSGCHVTVIENGIERAAGNLDVMTFENISRRRDLLTAYGAYSYAPLLIKAAAPTGLVVNDPDALPLSYNGQSLNLEVAHSGMGVLKPNSDTFGLLLEWIENGATENGLEPPSPPQTGDGPCSTAIPTGFDAVAARAEPGFPRFQQDVQPILERKGCAAGTCHGAAQADFYVTCGDNDDQVAFNYTQSRAFITAPADQSQLLIVPLSRDSGGIGHTGGDQFDGRDSADYIAIRDWAAMAGPIVFGTPGSPEEFFANHVQPIFLQRGCSFMNCHSPAATNDLKLRSGSQGFFSPLALQKNYDLLKYEFMALEFPKAEQGRAVSKNVLPAAGGIRHRGGPVLETPGRTVSTTVCPPFDPANAEASFQAGVPPGETQFSPYCTIQAWVELERAQLGTEVLPFTTEAQIIYVDRPGGGPTSTPLEFNTYNPGSELRIATFNLDADGHITTLQTDTALITVGACAGATNANADIRGPEVSNDGRYVAFGMRIGAGEGMQVWKYDMTTNVCTRLTTPATGNGITIDNFDPMWSPDGSQIVFASSRGGGEGPTRARSPGFQPQSDIWRMSADGSMPEQITFLSNSEIGPAMMREGRITMTTEKVYVDPDANQGDGVFHQLAGRRINWDKTDYHPLLAQRARSPYASPDDPRATMPTVDYAQATDIRERANGDFLFIASDVGARGGGGALTIFNRSAGTFEAGRRAIDEGFLDSVTFVAPAGDANMGRLTATTTYRGGFGLHDGEILASYATLNGTLGNPGASINWDIVSIHVDTNTGVATQRVILGGAGAQMDAVEVVKKPPGPVFFNKRQLVFGGQTNPSHASTAHIHFPDAPMVFTLLTGNLRRGHPVDAFREATAIEFYSEGRNTGTSGNTMGIYQTRTLLGRADLAEDGSTHVEVPAGQGVVMKLVNESGGVVVSMGEEHQMGPGEEISLGIAESLFDAACGGCHGSVSGNELDIATKPDVLTGASLSMSQTRDPTRIGP